MIEHIVSAAIQIDGVILSLPRPARHGQVMACAYDYLGIKPGREVQGFLTNTGRFVNRIEARLISYRAGQEPKQTGNDHELFSEDLW
jgi:hypothetical protein